MFIKTTAKKGNGKGAGFLPINNNLSNIFSIDDTVKIEINNQTIFSKIKKYCNRYGIYISKKISKNIIGKKITINKWKGIP